MSHPITKLVYQAQKELFGWIPYEEYAKMFPSETRAKIRSRVRREVWQEGVHVTRGASYDLWIHLANVKAWLEQREPTMETLEQAQARLLQGVRR